MSLLRKYCRENRRTWMTRAMKIKKKASILHVERKSVYSMIKYGTKRKRRKISLVTKFSLFFIFNHFQWPAVVYLSNLGSTFNLNAEIYHLFRIFIKRAHKRDVLRHHIILIHINNENMIANFFEYIRSQLCRTKFWNYFSPIDRSEKKIVQITMYSKKIYMLPLILDDNWNTRELERK